MAATVVAAATGRRVMAATVVAATAGGRIVLAAAAAIAAAELRRCDTFFETDDAEFVLHGAFPLISIAITGRVS
jgi:hypothetical protein